MNTSEQIEFCQNYLPKVSRTFAKPIEQLPEALRHAAMYAYLICRVADTVEDHPTFSRFQKKDLLNLFVDVMDARIDARTFDKSFADLEKGLEDDFELTRNLSHVMAGLSTIPEKASHACRRWAKELALGMTIYTQRLEGADGILTPDDEEDFERYCYFVAGTVGRLTSDVVKELTPEAYHPSSSDLAAGYGIALQMVNILKDITQDLDRGVCFVPRSILRKNEVNLRNLENAGEREKLKKGLQPLFNRARQLFEEKAIPYCLSIPENFLEIRIGFLLPVWLAIPTLDKLETSSEYLMPGKKVRISRLQVLKHVVECRLAARSDEKVLKHFDL